MAYWSLTSYKHDLLCDLCLDKETVRLLDSQNPNVDKNDSFSLLYNNIHPDLFVPETVNTADAYLLLDVEKHNNNRYNESYYEIYITIWCMVHRDRLIVKGENGIRTDLLADSVELMFYENEKKQRLKYGFNELKLLKSGKVPIGNNDFSCKGLVFTTNDLKHPISVKRGDYY